MKNGSLCHAEADVVFKPRPLKRALYSRERITDRQKSSSFSDILVNRRAGAFLEQPDAVLK